MNDALKISGNIAAILGLLICATSGLFRLVGEFYVFGFEAMTLFSGGIALLIAACLAKIELLLNK